MNESARMSLRDAHLSTNGDVPKWLKWLMTFIDRVGFPILVCIFLGWFLLFKMEDYEKRNAEAKQVIVTAINGNTDALKMLIEAVRARK